MINTNYSIFTQQDTTACNRRSIPESDGIGDAGVVQAFLNLADRCVEVPTTTKMQDQLMYAASQILADVCPKSIGAWALQESGARIGRVLEELAAASHYVRDILRRYEEFIQASVPNENTHFTENDDDDDDDGSDKMMAVI
jgi:hypothetical protein